MNTRVSLLAICLFLSFSISAQDLCVNATDEGFLGCGDDIAVSFNTGDTSDPEAVGCMTGVDGTWYTFMTDPNVTEFEITGGTYELFSGPDCSSLTPESDCGSPDIFTADPNTIYYILVGDNATVQTADISNEDCGSAAVEATLGCGDSFSVSGDATACTDPEAVGCMIDQAGVWYEFDVELDMPSFDISGSDFELFEGSCGSLVSLSDCGSPGTIMADGSTTYYLLVYGSVQIDAAPAPNNDLCNTATEINAGVDLTTCCGAIETDDDCGGQNAGVWFVYSGGGDAASFSFSNVDLSGSIGIEIYSGDCSALTLEDSYCGGPTSIDFEIANCGDDFYIHVTSSQGDCGSFSISATDVTGCIFAEACDDVTDTMMPSSGGGQVCLPSCTEYSCDGDCTSNGVWFSLMTDDVASYMEVIVNNANFDPVVSIYQGDDCGALTTLVGCATPDVGEVTPSAVNAMATYFIEVGVDGGGPGGDFDLCVLTDIAQVQCSEGEIEPTRPEYPDEDQDGPYCPGEIVNFCYEVDFTVDPIGMGNNCQWIQGIIPTIGGGWDLAATPLNTQGPSGGWFWLDEGNVDHNVDSPVLELISTPYGSGLAYGNGGLSAGDLLPGGWWYVSPGGGAGCTNDGDPDTMWGLPASCGGSSTVEFCFDLQVRELEDPADCTDPEFTDLKVHIFTMADGQTGCWSNNSCAGDVPVVFDAQMDCTSLIEVIAENKEICSGESVDIMVETSDGSSADIIVEVIEEGNTSGAEDWMFSGTGVIPDVITNEGEDVEVVIYEAYALSPPSVCRGPITTIEVIVYPEIFIDPEDPYYICYGIENEITPPIFGGTGGPYEVDWSNGATGTTIILPEDPETFPGEYEITMTVTDDLGCTAEEVIEYEIVEPINPYISGPANTVCKDGVDDFITFTLEFEDVGTGPYEFMWDSNPGGLDFFGSNDEVSVIIDDENSSAKTYTIFGIVIDDLGCEYRADTTFVVDNGPELEFNIDECFGIGYTLKGYNIEGDPTTYEIYYDQDGEWDMTYDNLDLYPLVAGPLFGNSIDYFAEDFGFYILVGTSTNGCKDFVILEVPPLATPLFTAMPNDTVCAGTTVTIGVSNVMEFIEFDWSTGSSFDTTMVTPNDTMTYYLEAELENGCEVIDSITIIVNPIPEINITGSLSFCPGGFANLTAQGDSTSTYLWMGPGGEILNTQSVEIDVAGTWSIMITTEASCANMGTVDITQDTQLDPQIIGGNFCSGESVILDGGQGFDSYEWLDGLNNVVGTDPTLEVSIADLYTLNVVLGNCTGTDNFQVDEIQPLPDALNALTTDACNIDSGNLPTVIDLTSFENGMVSGTWINENGIPVVDPTAVDFEGIPPSQVVYTFETNSAVAPCEDDIYDFTINILDCACPSVAINAPSNFCVGVDTFDLSLILITTEPGNWSVDSPEIEILNNSLLIINETVGAGDYTLTYELTIANIPPSCPSSNSVMFSIYDEPEAEILASADVCNVDTGNGADFIDLDDLYVSGSTGDWSTSEPGLVIDADNVVDFSGQMPGNYRFFYQTNDAITPCQNISYSSTIVVEDCSCPELELMPLPAMCSTGGIIDLNGFLLNPTAEPGNWSISGPDNSVLIGNEIDPLDAPAGLYTVTFSFNTPPGGSCIESVSQEFTVIDPPQAMFIDQAVACNGTNITFFPTNLDLTSFVVGDAGFWTAPPEYNNGMIDDITDVDFTGVEPGIYLFTYTTNTAQAPCEDIEIILNLEVANCNCPLLSFNTPSPLCNDADETNLNELVFPQVGPGDWTFIDGPEQALFLNDSIWQIFEITPGLYTFEYTLDEMVPTGCTQSSQISIEVNETPNVSVVPEATACNTQSVQGPTCLDLNSFVTGASGEWTAPANYTGDFSDVSNVCFEGLPIGSTYEFVFLTNTAVTPCVDRRLTTLVTILDCDCPNLNISTPSSICNVGGSLDLTTLEDPNIEPGSWSVSGGPQAITLNNNVFDADGIDAGTYTLQYTPDATPPMDCPQNSEVELEVVRSPQSGLPSDRSVCVDDNETINLFDLLEGEDSGGVWEEVSAVQSTANTFDSSAGTFNTTGNDVGVYLFSYGFIDIDPCADVMTTVVVNIEDLPQADAGLDQELNCSETEVLLGGSGTSSGNNFEYSWSESSGVAIANNTTQQISAEQAGTYVLEVTDLTTGCKAYDEVVVTVDSDLPSFGTDVEPSPCFGFNGGEIIISSVQGGDGNYLYSIDGGNTWSSDTQFGGLAPGTYTVMLQDGNGCIATQSGIIITEPAPLTVDAGDDQEVEYGNEFYTIQINPSIDPSLIQSIVWTENGVEICSGDFNQCGSIQVDPDEVGEYCATITDINGCVAEDCVFLRERIVRDVFIPNVFSPGSGDRNSTFYVHSDQFIKAVEEFRIFDRWGEMVFNADTNHPPNDPDFGWDGNFEDKPVEQGVYVYVIKIIFDNDQTQIFAGDITVIR